MSSWGFSDLEIGSILYQAADIPIILIANPDFQVPDLPDINVILKLPFTIRKLYNRVVTLLPGDGKKMIKAGPIYIDSERQIVRNGQLETKLTPRLLKLLHIFSNKHILWKLMHEFIQK